MSSRFNPVSIINHDLPPTHISMFVVSRESVAVTLSPAIMEAEWHIMNAEWHIIMNAEWHIMEAEWHIMKAEWHIMNAEWHIMNAEWHIMNADLLLRMMPALFSLCECVF